MRVILCLKCWWGKSLLEVIKPAKIISNAQCCDLAQTCPSSVKIQGRKKKWKTPQVTTEKQILVSPEIPGQLEIPLRKSQTISSSESSVNRSKIYLSFQNKHPVFLNDFMQIRLPSPCSSALSPEPLEIQTLRENLPTYSKPGPGWQEVANLVNCY